ncbi:MAG: 50S ribosomal protein L10, partial [Hadesarchaea archaeon]|nr:50S ribosomal protein L10 [Hadesarchaea archaeon]
RDAYINAVNLSITVNYPTNLTIGAILAKASAAAYNVALNASIPVAEVMPMLLAQANVRMLCLAAAILAKDANALDEKLKELLAAPEAEAKIERKGEEKSKEEKTKEEEITGLGALFG